ncbi:hypothetical protein G7046_g59 [Stylonectria norvegica]|nr:hypothetical protein G7046_g59 [Stylonectria norvegica]
MAFSSSVVRALPLRNLTLKTYNLAFVRNLASRKSPSVSDPQATSQGTFTPMDRPRNNQQRAPRGNQRGGFRPARGVGTPQQRSGTVPTIQQVVRGSAVFIVLKDDQPTGEETQGIVQDIFTRGNHPRGIKVRLRDGQVGRVQRMGAPPAADASASAMSAPPRAISGAGTGVPSPAPARSTMKYTDVRNDDYLDGPPPRGLADFMPNFGEEVEATPTSAAVAEVKCPFCDGFTGDEAAVTHHIEREHLT